MTAVRIVGDRLVQTFGSGVGKPLARRPLSRNHIYWHGGQLAFGKLTMADTDLELVDMDPADAFDFSVDDWNAQLVAGYSKTLPNRGLKAHMPDLQRPAFTTPCRRAALTHNRHLTRVNVATLRKARCDSEGRSRSI